MNRYEMEVALMDGFTLTYIDFNDFSRNYISYIGADSLLLTKEIGLGEEESIVNMSELLAAIDEDETIYVEVFTF